MVEFGLALIVSSFVAGVFTFFAPCTLPLVPAFLGVISGVKQEDMADQEKLKKLKWKIFDNAVFYVLGFSLVFILFGVAFSLLGKIFFLRIWLQRIGGILIILLGLFLMGLLKISWLNAERQIHVPKLMQTANKTNSFGIGALFALGWSPCVGPLLGSVLLLASQSGTILQGTFLLIVFSAGLAVPFLITSLLVGRAYTAFSRWNKAITAVNIIAGMFLIVLGILLVSNQFTPAFNYLRALLLRFDFYQNFVSKFL